jgi:hypothetical protein
MDPTPSQRRALQIIKLASEQEDEAERLRNALRWVAGMLRSRPRRGAGALYDLLSNTEDPIRGVAIEWAARVKLMVPR